MEYRDTNTYYALVSCSTLQTKEDIAIQGNVIHSDTVLPNEPRLLYGTNGNDVAKIRIIEAYKKITYDVFTTRQSVVFWEEIEEYDIPRDTRIIIWEGKDDLEIQHDSYQIVTPDLFNLIVSTCKCELNKEHELLKSIYKEESVVDPKANLKKQLLYKIDLPDYTYDRIKDSHISKTYFDNKSIDMLHQGA